MDSPRSSGHTSDHLQPPPSPYPASVDPSPVDSNGTSHTDHTEIEEDAQENHPSEDGMSEIRSPGTDDIVSPASQDGQTKPHTHKLKTAVRRADSDDAPPSVIHAPDSFKQFASLIPIVKPTCFPDVEDKQTASARTTPIDTAVSNSVADRSTLRAQTRQDFLEDLRRRSVRKSVNLADIAEYEDHAAVESSASSVIEQDDSQSSQSQDGESMSIGTQTMGQAIHGIHESEKEVAALRCALDECWILCNSLAKLSQHHRTRMFHYSGGSPDMQEHAWRTCWRLCQKLYESREENLSTQIGPTLELWRDFCRELLDVRQRGDEASDSVL
ncbi:unnamed protein product [Alternaria alternata]